MRNTFTPSLMNKNVFSLSLLDGGRCDRCSVHSSILSPACILPSYVKIYNLEKRVVKILHVFVTSQNMVIKFNQKAYFFGLLDLAALKLRKFFSILLTNRQHNTHCLSRQSQEDDVICVR